MANRNNTVQTRFTTGKVRLTYAFLWTPRSASEEDGSQKGERYSTCILIPKNDQQTIERFHIALQHAVALGQKKGLWGATLPSNFKFPLRDGDAECAEKGEEYAGHWFLNASAIRRPQIVDINRNDIWEESDVYSGCYARVCSRSGVLPARSGAGSRRVSGGNAGRSCPGVSPADSPSSDGAGVPGADRGYRLSERRGSGREHPASPAVRGGTGKQGCVGHKSVSGRAASGHEMLPGRFLTKNISYN